MTLVYLSLVVSSHLLNMSVCIAGKTGRGRAQKSQNLTTGQEKQLSLLCRRILHGKAAAKVAGKALK